MERSINGIHTADELLDFLNTIPRGILERLPLSVIFNDGMEELLPPFDIEAFETTETEGCIERGFRFSVPEAD